MPNVLALGQISIVDLTDAGGISVSLSCNVPQTQIYDPNSNAVSPDWSADVLTITPAIYSGATAIIPTDSSISVEWTCRIGNGNASALSHGESVVDGVLYATRNVLSEETASSMAYICTVTHTNPSNHAVTTVSDEILFTQLKTALNETSISIGGMHVFTYGANSSVYPQTIMLTATAKGVSVSGWYYKDSSGALVSYPGSSQQLTLTVTPLDPSFYNDRATIRVETDREDVFDEFSIYKVQDGSSVSTAFLSNEQMSFQADSRGRVNMMTTNVRVIAYTGATKVLPRLGTISGAPTGMSVSVGDPVGYEMPISISLAANATLGDTGPVTGVISIPVTSPVAETLSLKWSKLISGYSIGVVNTDVTYLPGVNETTRPTGTWDTDFPTDIDEGDVIWLKTRVEYADHTVMDNYSTVTVGNLDPNITTGLVIDHVTQYYLRSHNEEGVTPSSQGWDTDLSLMQPSAYMTYLWGYKTFHYTNGTTSNSDAHIIAEYNETAGDITDVFDAYLVSSTQTGASGIWSDTASAITGDTPYLLNYTVVTYADESEVQTDPMVVATYDPDSRVVSDVTEYFSASDSNSVAPLRWTEDPDEALATMDNVNMYLWSYEKILFNTMNVDTLEQEFTETNKRVIAVYGGDSDTMVSFSLITPQGSVFLNGQGSLPIRASALLGTADVSLNGTYVWEEYQAGGWRTLSETGSVLTVAGSSISGVGTYRCRFTYGRREYVDIVTLIDQTDSTQVTVESSGGDVFKNGIGTSTLLCRVWKGPEVDTLGTEYSYTWYRMDADGVSLDGGNTFATTKSVEIDSDDVEDLTTFFCEVRTGTTLIGRGQITIRDEADIVISPTEPAVKTVNMLWLDTSLSAAGILKRWDGEQWIETTISQDQLSSLQATVTTHASSISQLNDKIESRVSKEEYEQGRSSTEEWVSQNYTTITQTAENIDLVYRQTTNYTDGYRTYVENYMRFDDSGLELGQTNSPFKTRLTNEKLAFLQDNEEVAYMSNDALYISQARMTNTMSIGEVGTGWFDWQMLSTGLGMKWKEPGVY